MREFQDIFDAFPYFLFFLLPVMIVLSPINPCEAAHEFPVHRLAQYELTNSMYGSKVAAISMEARAKSASKVLRKIIVSKAEEMSIVTFNDLSSSGAGGMLLLVPPKDANLTQDQLETFLSFEEHSLNGDIGIPIYYAEQSPELLELLDDLNSSGQGAENQQTSGAQVLLNGIISNGFQLVSSASVPKVLTDQSITSIQADLRGISKAGFGEEDSLPIILIVAHYDTSGAAPSLSFGADSNGSGVAILMELARLWSGVYRNSKAKPNFNLAFLLSGGGKVNFLGSKKWLDENKEDPDFDLANNLKMAVCLDGLGKSNTLNMFVSKPPKDTSLPSQFLKTMEILAKNLYSDVKVNLVHKKINLAHEFLAWEHERFSIHKLSALTLSHFESNNVPERNSILDRTVDESVVKRNTHLIAESIACIVYHINPENCQGNIFKGSLSPSEANLNMWISELTSTPRAASLLVGSTKDNNKPLIRSMTENLKLLTDRVTQHSVKRDQREPEYTFYDTQTATMTSYRIKPAVFDLLLTVSIAGYLGVVYVMMMKWSDAFVWLSSFSKSPVKKKGEINGNSKMKAY